MKARILIHAAAAKFIRRVAMDHVPEETGGILLGHREDGNVVVTHAIVVPPPEASRNRYVRLDDRADEQLQDYLRDREANDPAGYVGEWHSHPGPPGPSSLDIASTREIASTVGRSIALVVVRPMHQPILSGVVAVFMNPKRVRAHKAEINLVAPTVAQGDDAENWKESDNTPGSSTAIDSREG